MQNVYAIAKGGTVLNKSKSMICCGGNFWHNLLLTSVRARLPGLNHLKISGGFVQSFTVLHRIFLSAIMNHSSDSSILRIWNIQEHKKNINP